MVDPGLVRHASDFATKLNETLEKVLGQMDEPYLEAEVRQSQVLVWSQGGKGIPLHVDEVPVYGLQVRFHCAWNSSKQYLAIRKSSYQITVDSFPEPVLRFDFTSDARDVPISHVNIHSHHPGLQKAMASAKSKSRAFKAADDTSALHIPTGGLRFRPSLEDVLEMLIRDFKIDATDAWKISLMESRSDFRDSQLAAAVHDNPGEAVRALEDLGYVIAWERTAPKPPPRNEKRGAY